MIIPIMLKAAAEKRLVNVDVVTFGKMNLC